LTECVGILKFKAHEKGIKIIFEDGNCYWPSSLMSDELRLK
jgi:hypothetical protein